MAGVSFLLSVCLLAATLAHHRVLALGHCTSSGVYLNDDFDASTSINTTYWSSSSGVLVQQACTTSSSVAVLAGNALVFGATGDTARYLTSKGLSLKNAEVIQFDAAACPYPATTSTITARLAYSTDGGRTYQTVRYFTVSKGGPGAHVVVNVTAAMKASTVHLRIEQYSSFSGQGSQAWALDNIAVLGKGPQEIEEDFDDVTPCNVLGQSRGDYKTYCSSSFKALVFSGQTTSSVGHFVTSVPLFIAHTGLAPARSPSDIFSEEFEPIPAIPGTKWASIVGGRISIPECGAIDTTGAGYAAYFNQTGTRSIQTQSLDLTNARSLSFKVRIGGGSGCETADSGEDVVVEYQAQGSSSFIQLTKLAYNGYTSAKTVSITIPSAAQTSATVLRWRQLSNSGTGTDEWAIDHVRVTDSSADSLGTIFSESFDTAPTIGGTKWASISGGSFVTPDCGTIDLQGASSRAAFFQRTGSRSIQTQRLDLTLAEVLSFRVRIGGSSGSSCETADANEDVVVEYQPSGSSSFTQLKKLAYNGYLTATTVTITLPSAARTAATAIRWRQLQNSGSNLDEWAIDAITITGSVQSPVTPTAAPTLTTIFSDNFDTPPTIPGTKWAAIFGGTFSTPDCGSIDLSGFSSRAAFFSQAGSRSIQTVGLDLTSAQSLLFRIRIGGTSSSSTCEQADSGEDVVVEYKPAGSSSFTRLMLLAYNGYTAAKQLTLAIPTAAKTKSTVLQWRQLKNSGSAFDEWALDHVAITGYVSNNQPNGQSTTIFSEDFYPTPSFPGTKWQQLSSGSITTPDCGSIDVSGFSSQAAFFSGSGNRYIQTIPLNLANALTLSFRVQIGGGGNCENADNGEDVVVEYQLQGSSTFVQLRKLGYNSYTTAQTVTITLSAAVKTAYTVLRWRQLTNSGSNYDEWAIDHIRIVGTTQTPPTPVPVASGSLFSEDFYPSPTFGGTKWLSITGGTVTTPGCGGIDLPGYSSQAAFFTSTGSRSIETQVLDLRLAQTLSFRVRIGGGSGCETADSGEDVVVEYRTLGISSYTQITKLDYNGYTTAKTVTLAVPIGAQTSATYIRWRQLSNSGSSLDEWAIDHIRISGSAYNRHHTIEFQLCMGCGAPYTQQQSASYDIQLEYSIDYGQSWGLVQTECLPSSSECMQTLVSSQYSSFLFTNWRRLTVQLSSAAISNNTEIRWRQPSSAAGIEWALDDLYLGVQCPGFCNGHGRCTKAKGHYQGLVCGGNGDGQPCARSFMYNNQTYHSCTRDGREAIDNQLWCATTSDYNTDGKWGYCVCGVCQCDPGYSGKSCETVTQTLPHYLNESFEDDLLSSKWGWVAGGSIDVTCGTVASGSSMVFNLGRSRLVETVDLDLTQSTTLQFTIQVGSTRSGCPRPTDSTENIYLQYSTNGGVTWNVMRTFAYNSGTRPSQQNIVLLNATKTPSTRIRWYQPKASGSNTDVWALDDVYIDSVLTALPAVENFDPIRNSLWKFYTGSKVEPFCSSSANALHFSYSYTATSRFASTVSLRLTRSTYIQFDIVVDCGQTLPLSTAYVTLQYSTDGGNTWKTLDNGCLPLSSSCGSYRRASVYRSGLFSKWRRVTVSLSNTQLASSPSAVVQLRWLGQSTNTAYDWAIDNVYIGEGCPGLCSGHGRCTANGTCACDPGYSGSQCSSYSKIRPTYIKERFDQAISSSVSVIGGGLGTACGVLSASTAMTFNLAGEREFVTVDMDASKVSFIQFSYNTGSSSSSSVCTSMSSNNQVPIGDYSTDGGASWTTLGDMRYYYTYRSPAIKTIAVPQAARTKSTRFRMWQSGFFTSGAAAWAIDDMFIGGYVIANGSYLSETFEPLQESNWLFYPGGQVITGNCSATTPALYFDRNGGGQRHATTKIFTVQVEPLVLVNATFDSSLPTGWTATGGQVSTQCGSVDNGSALVFSNAGTRELTTPNMDTTVAAEVQFYLMIGGDPLRGRYCDNAEQYSEGVQFYYSTNSGQNWTLWETYQYDQYKNPQKVTETLPDAARTTATRLRWVQNSNDGQDTDVWSIDSIVIVQDITPVQYVAQFDINVGCGQFTSSTSGSISFDFIAQGGTVTTWTNVEQECVPGSCSTSNYQKASSYYSSGGWRRMTVALPSNAVTKASLFRWYQSASSSVPWGVDNIYIGHDCPMLCSGHGRCMPGYCVCDAGYTGNDCGTPLLQLLTELRDDFSDGTVDSKKWSFYQGVTGTQPVRCGPVSGPSALLFAALGPRQIISVDMNTTTAQYLQFRIRIGTYTSSSSTCNVVDSVDEGVLVHHSNDGGTTWQLLKNLAYNAYTNPGYVTIELPTGAKSPSTRFRWWQPHNQGANKDEWVLGDIFIGGTATNKVILEERFDPLDGGNWLFYPNGQVQPFCLNRAPNGTSSGNAMVLAGSVGQRFITTRDLVMFSNANLIFDMNVGCGSNFSSDQYSVQLQYSKDRGNTWNLVNSGCNPSTSSCGANYYAATSYRAGEFRNWRRVSVRLPPATVSTQTRFRWYQSSYSTAFTWAIDNVFIGATCPNFCSGHGRCRTNANESDLVCDCDDGHGGVDCQPISNLPVTFTETFESQASLQQNWLLYEGGAVGTRCGIVASGKSLSFYLAGTRMAVTRDLNLTSASFMLFYIQVGGGSCSRPSQLPENMITQYSTNGGITWTNAVVILYSHSSSRVLYLLPDDARQPATRFRWWQPSNSGVNRDIWSIDEIHIGGNKPFATSIFEDFIPNIHSSQWTMYVNGHSGPYCNHTNALVFDNSQGFGGSRTLVSQPLNLNATSSAFVQFWLNIGCGANQGSGTGYDVQLQYALGSDSFQLVRTNCLYGQTSSACAANSYQLSSSYSWTLFGTWRRVTVPLPSAALSVATILSWSQTSFTSSSTWGIANVYVGDGCPSMCSGHGNCTAQGVCSCDAGFGGPTCVPTTPSSIPKHLSDDFDSGSLSPKSWTAVSSGTIGTLCGTVGTGQSLYFNGAGLRLAETVDINVTQKAYIQFEIVIGSGGSCETADSNEDVLLQYSTNAGITWQLLSVLRYSSYRTASVFFQNLPLGTRTSATRFRWWQSSHSGSGYDNWAIDDVSIAVYPANSTEVVENFNPINADAWTFYRGSSIGSSVCYSPNYAPSLQFFGTSNERSLLSGNILLSAGAIIQFSMVMGCNSSFTYNKAIQLQYSTNSGTSWQSVQNICRVGTTCVPVTFASSYYSDGFRTWKRVTLALSSSISIATGPVQFRWIQQTPVYANEYWAIDDIYIGSNCSSGCNGHGKCVGSENCKCDVGYSGPTCSVVRDSLRTTFQQSFESAISPNDWLLVVGGHVGQDCGVIATGNSLVFNGAVQRQAVTVDMDTRNAKIYRFTLRMGGGSCRLPSSGEGVAFQYSTNGGITWTRLSAIRYYNARSPTVYSGVLPSVAQASSTRFRWIQASNSGPNYDVWSIDDVYVGSSVAGNFFYESFEQSTSNLLGSGNWVSLGAGTVAVNVCSRSGQVLQQNTSSSAAMQTGPIALNSTGTYVIQFDLVMKCGVAYSQQNPVIVEYNTNAGVGTSWTSLRTKCFPGTSSCNSNPDLYARATTYYSTEYKEWRRVTIPIPAVALGQSISLRWRQSYSYSDTAWAIDNVYIGPSCTNNCLGHGTCQTDGTCLCDNGYGGSACVPTRALPTELKEEFEDDLLRSKWSYMSGGSLATGCGPLAAGKTLYFSQAGLREAVTVDVDTRLAYFIRFYIRIGGTSTSSSNACDRADSAQEGVLFQFSRDGGITWRYLYLYNYYSYRTKQRVALTLPAAARANSVRFRWWQPYNSGASQDEWALDDVYIGGSVRPSRYLIANFDPIVQSRWLFTPSGSVEQYCQSTDNALVFKTGTDGAQHDAITQNIGLSPGDFVQFEINMGCGSNSGQSSPVTLNYATNAGQSVLQLTSPCRIADLQAATCQNPSLGSIYSADVYGGWSRINVAIPNKAISNQTRFLWQQASTSSSPTPTWAINNVYIGRPCPDLCANNGRCVWNNTLGSPYCVCDPGFSGNNCNTRSVLPPTTLKDDFDNGNVMNGVVSGRLGGGIDTGCGTLSSGKSLYFSAASLRAAATVELDTRNTRLIQFYIRVGSSSSSSSNRCDASDTANEGVLLIYSTNGRITWNQLQLFNYYSYRSPSFISVRLPPSARSRSTFFVWWQPQNSGANQDEWAIDDVYIGGEDVNPISMYEAFDPIDENNWVFYHGATLNGYCASVGRALVFSGSSSTRSATTRQLRLKLPPTTAFTWNGGAIGSSFTTISGGALGRPCTSTGLSDVILFNGGDDQGTVTRQAVTRDIDATAADFISFNIVIGGSSGLCEATDNSNEGVKLHFSTDGGNSWTLLQDLAYNAYGTYRVVKINIPDAAKSNATRFRWTQGSYSQKGVDTWALGSITVSSIDPPPNYQLQFNLVFNCNGSDTSVNSYVQLQMSTESSPTWQDVNTFCRPPGGSTSSVPTCTSATNFNAPSRWFWHGNDRWKTVTVSLMSTSLSLTEYTRFRFSQGGNGYSSSSQPFAIDNVIIGRSCPNFCSGHGECLTGRCLCDFGFSGSSCSSVADGFSQGLEDSFDSPWQPRKRTQWTSVIGGGLGTPCSSSAGSLLVMNGVSSLRQIATVDLDTRYMTTFKFTFLLGGSGCDLAERGDDVYLSYSKNGGITWTQIMIFGYGSYRVQQTFNISASIPSDARAEGVRFQWTQYQNSGANTDVWIIDDVFIGGSCLTNACQNNGTCLEIAVESHNCICPPGFSGSQCEQKIDPCLAKPCKNGGTCTSSADAYTCTCPATFSGRLCDISTSACISSPCLNNGVCQDLAFYSNQYDSNSCIGRCGQFIRGMACQCDPNCARFPPGCCRDISTFCGPNSTSYVCNCTTGYEGLNCERMTDYCATAPCFNGATCVSTLTGATCQCPPGFTGSRCEININECTSSPCQNGGTCADGVNSYTCTCPRGFNGDYCEIQIDYCLTQPCGSGSTCVPLLGGYRCVCRQGYTGQNCTQIVDNCAAVPIPCANSGLCINSIGFYTCQCSSLFTGSHCETEILPCSSFPCVNQGTCVNEKGGNFSCQCAAGFSGIQCEIPPPGCFSDPCKNGGTCVSLGSTFSCYCPDGWTGVQCETEVNECLSAPCQHGGTCVDRVGSFECRCIPGYADPTCSTNVDDCRGKPCLNGGTCTDGINQFSCTCLRGFTGQMCNVTLDSCLSNPCIYGQCVSQGSLGFNCKCNQGYSGTQCGTEIDECSQSLLVSNVTCYNGGTCIDRVGYYDCSCVPGYTGIRCETDIDECSPNPCSRGATCQNLVNGYRCVCPPGLTGQRCQQDINECLSNPCMNEGVCSNGKGYYLCRCKPTYTGSNCETKVSSCISNPCMNGGQCSEFTEGGFSCSCASGFNGVRCENMVDFCSPSPCQNGGTCMSQVGDYRCQCPVGYSGKNCSQYTGGCGSDPCHNQGVCQDLAGGNIRCICVGNYTGTYCQTPVTIDRCGTNPCKNGGTCQNTQDGKVKCLCIPRYKGMLCEQQISPCSYYNVTCSGRGQCISNNSTYTYVCQCQNGFTGQTCESQIDYCRLQQPCKNGATCNSFVGGYSCACLKYFTGRTCETGIDPCDSLTSYCHNGGTCVGRAGTGSFMCHCPRTLYGNQCDNDYDECKITAGLCQNGGRCINFFGGYQCVCPVLTTGQNCETVIPSQCSSNPCQNGGRCAAQPGGLFVCVCPPGFTGTRCSTNIDECQSNPCQHSGKCEDRANGFYCKCDSTGYEGVQCEKPLPTPTTPPNPCGDTPSANPCKNRAPCVPNGRNFSCVCVPGYNGPLCETNINECQSSPCQNGGRCQNLLDQFQCDCTGTGFTGQTCSQPTPSPSTGPTAAPVACQPNPCQNNGICQNEKCQCTSAFTGQFCDVRIFHCQRNPCRDNEICQDDLTQNSYTCTCRPGYTGSPCHPLSSCEPNPCANSGTCSVNQQSNLVQCACTGGYTGSTCNLAPIRPPTSQCQPRPCRNGGTCTIVEQTGKFLCVCLSGYRGDTCELEGTREPGNPGGVSGKTSGGDSGTPTWVYIVAGVGGVLILVIIIVAIILYKRRVGGYQISGPVAVKSTHFANPLYGNVEGGSASLSGQPIAFDQPMDEGDIDPKNYAMSPFDHSDGTFDDPYTRVE